MFLAGEVSGQQQEHSGDSCKETPWRETWTPAADLGPRQMRTSTGVVCVDVFQMSECQLSLQGMLVWYLPNLFEGRFVFFIGVTCPCRINPLTSFFLFYDKHRSLRWSLDHFSNILTQAACCVVCKSPIFFLRKINTAHYLAEKRSLCQAATHSTGRQPPSRLSHFS